MRLLESSLYISDLKKAIGRADLSHLNGKSIFVTGGLGLICSTIVDVLLIYGKVDMIYVGARNKEAFEDKYGGIEKVVFVQYDALDNFKLDFKPDFIIHGAGLASPELYTTMPVETILSNIKSVYTLLEFLRENNKTSRFLYISSSEVYGSKETDEPFIEGNYGSINIDNIRSSYAIAKSAAEMICKAYSVEYGIDTVIVRPGHIFGPSAKESDKRISSDFAYKAARGKKIEMKSSGTQKRSYCYSIDCAIQILYVLTKGEVGQAYNIGHDEIITIRDMVEIYAKAGNVKISMTNPMEKDSEKFNPMKNSSLNNNKVKTLGYTDTFTVEESLRHTVELLKELEKGK